MDKIVHIDVGPSPTYARVLGVKPFVDLLCGCDPTEGDSIRDSLIAMRVSGGYPAAATCSKCKLIAETIYMRQVDLKAARRIVGEK